MMSVPKAIGVDATSLRSARLEAPVSKSDAQRALVLFPDLALPADEDLPVDVRVLRRGLEVLRSPDASGRAPAIDCHDGGLPFRILVGQAAVTPGAHVALTGSARLGERPHEPLLASLERALSPSGLVLARGAPWPLVVTGARAGLRGAEDFRIDARGSSQFATSLLLAAARLVEREQRALSVVLEGAAASPGYLDLTIDWLRRAGFEVTEDNGRVTLGAARSAPATPSIPSDWSSLAYLLLIAWRTGSTVGGVDLGAPHPDRAIVRILAEIGVSVVERGGGDVTVEGIARAGVRASGAECPDLLPTLAALACVLPAPSRFTEVSILRGKESDRLAGIEALVRAGGGVSRLEGDALTIEPGPPAAPGSMVSANSAGDHRLAMASATLAVLLGARLTLEDPDVVEKSFPAFWRQLARVCTVVLAE